MYIDQYNTIRLHLSKTFMTLFNVFFTALGALGGLGLNAIFWGGLVCLIPDSFLIRHGAFEVPTKWVHQSVQSNHQHNPRRMRCGVHHMVYRTRSRVATTTDASTYQLE